MAASDHAAIAVSGNGEGNGGPKMTTAADQFRLRNLREMLSDPFEVGNE